MAAAKEKLNKLKLSPKEREEYERFVERLRKIASLKLTELEDVKDLVKEEVEKAKALKEEEMIIKLANKGKIASEISDLLDIHLDKVIEIIEKRSVS